MKAIFKTIKNCVKKLKENFPIILDLIFLVMLYVVIKYSVVEWYKNFIGLASLYVVITFIKLVEKTYGENSFPTVNKRFTRKLDDEVVVINKKDWQEAIIYLSQVEDYLGKV